MKKVNGSKSFHKNVLITPSELLLRYPITSDILNNILSTRKRISNILSGKDKRLLVVIGPCSIHDPISAIEYAKKLYALRCKYFQSLEIVMRTYFEKPRTVVGWKGLITDPFLNETFNINDGLKIARKLLLNINEIGMPASTEFLDVIISQFISDLISWGAIGARTTESQIHRELASSLPCPIGFKNSTEGNIMIAIDAIRSSNARHVFLVPNQYGKIIIEYTKGNSKTHIIMRGGKIPNYHKKDIDKAISLLKKFNLPEYLMIDFSHANSLKEYSRQLLVADDVSKQIYDGSISIAGVMIESFLEEGSQLISKNLKYGQSITDACIGWEDSEKIIKQLSNSVKKRF